MILDNSATCATNDRRAKAALAFVGASNPQDEFIVNFNERRQRRPKHNGRSLLAKPHELRHQKIKFSPSRVLGETQSDRAGLSAFQAAPRKTIIAENSIQTIKPIAAATPP
jgi:hypothetical protein